MQQMLGILAWFKPDSHWQTLNDFHIVAGRIFRRQQAEPIAAGPRHVLHVTAIGSPKRIDVNGHALTAMHAGELRLLEVRDHPDVVGLGYEHQRLPWLTPRAQLNGALTDDAIGGP